MDASGPFAKGQAAGCKMEASRVDDERCGEASSSTLARCLTEKPAQAPSAQNIRSWLTGVGCDTLKTAYTLPL